MKKKIRLFIAIFGVISLTNCTSQKIKFNPELKKELSQILFTDQVYREFIDSETSEQRKEEIAKQNNLSKEELAINIWTLINKIDAENIVKIENIISKYGYPGKSLVGEPENTTAFYVIQHNPNKIPQYLPLIEKSAKNDELPFKYYAMMLDRKLTNERKPQIYGTQIGFQMITNKNSGKQEQFIYVLPIEDAKNVNKRRKEAGFETTVEENAKGLGVEEYKEYTYDELNKILK